MKKTLLILLLLITQIIFSQGRRFFTKIFKVNSTTSLELTDDSGQPLIQGNMYKVQLVTTDTATRTGAEYLVWYSEVSAAWQLRAVSLAGKTSNHPLLILDNNIVKISMLHTSKYTVKVFVEEIISVETDAMPNMFGSSYQWQNEPAKLFYMDGYVGIGTSSPDTKLTVNGTIHATEVKVTSTVPVPDYVFANDYKLKTLQEVEEYIKANSHLPEIPSAQEIEKNGLLLAEMNMSLLKKVEELTLYMIEQSKEIKALKKENESFKSLSERFSKIENQLNNQN